MTLHEMVKESGLSERAIRAGIARTGNFGKKNPRTGRKEWGQNVVELIIKFAKEFSEKQETK